MSINVLFLCTGNSARSILAEVMINQVITQPGVKAYSAGSKPNGEVNPGALEELKKRGYSTVGLSSKSWDQFSNTQSPSIDWVITLCDNAAAEACPIFPGACQKEHWGLPDPATGDATFSETFDRIRAKVETFYQKLP